MTGSMTDSDREDFQFDGQWAKTVWGDQFLLGSRNDVHLFSTEENLQLLSEADVLHADGTFNVCLRLLYQRYSQ